MSRSALAAGVRHLRSVMALHGRDQESDEQLLHAFASRRDDSAFAALVSRHGPMVMNVCRRVLGQQQDAEDAFQAVFLVLARKAAGLRDKTALASFLHGTAYRMAMKAKQSAARRRQHEGQAPSRAPVDPADELSWREVRTLLDEEIARLPEKYRSVFILCILENVSREEAAKRLGLKAGTVSSRLTTARKRLGQRLARRGVELTAVLAAAAAMTPPASALPMALMASTIKAALATAAGEELAGIVSASAADLVQSATTAMMVSKAKLATVVLLIVVTSGSLVGLSRRASGPLAATTEPPAATAEDTPKAGSPQREAAKSVEIQGRVLGADGKSKAGAKLLLLDRKGNVKPLGVTAADGRFTVSIAKDATKHWGSHRLIAQADGSALDFLELYQCKGEKPVELRLVKDHPIRGRIVNTEGKPVRGVRVAAVQLEVYGNNSLETFRVAWMKFWTGGSGLGLEKQIWLDEGALFSAATDADGRFTLHGVGVERTVHLRLSGAGIADTPVWVANRAGFDPKPYNQAVLDSLDKRIHHANWRWSLLSGPDVAVVAEAEKIIRGVVADADTGKGQARVVVQLTQDSDEHVEYPPEAKTDAQGRYEIHGVRKTKKYMLGIAADPVHGYMSSQVWAADTIAHQPIRADIKIKKGVIVTGHVIDGATGKAIPGYVMAAVLNDNPFANDYPQFGSLDGLYESSDDTDADHAFRVVTIPGPMLLMGKAEGASRFCYKRTGADPKYPKYFKNGIFLGYNTMAHLQGHWNRVLEIKPGIAVVKQDIVLERIRVRTAVIQDAEGSPLAGTWAAGFAQENYYPA